MDESEEKFAGKQNASTSRSWSNNVWAFLVYLAFADDLVRRKCSFESIAVKLRCHKWRSVVVRRVSPITHDC